MFVGKETAQSRYDICKQCPHLSPITKQCNKCGCFMKIKVKLRSAKCPISKW